MKEPIWLTQQHVLTFHAKQIHEHGGSHGVRDLTLLESALHRPQNLYHYEQPSIHDLAASYGHGIIKNHPFIDGNKRTGIITVGIFLFINGFSIEVPEPDLVMIALAVADSTINEKEFSQWFEKNSKKYRIRRYS